MLVASMGTNISSFESEVDRKSDTLSESAPSVKPTGELQIEAPLKFVRHVTQLKQELIRKLIWKRGSEQQ